MKRVEIRFGAGVRCGQVWEAFTPEFNKKRQDQPMAYPKLPFDSQSPLDKYSLLPLIETTQIYPFPKVTQ